MIVGFTGTRRTLLSKQQSMLELTLELIDGETPIFEAHHGDCVGADEAFDRYCQQLSIERHAHPGPSRDWRAFCRTEVVHPVAPYLDRNRTIVDVCDVLIACPDGPERQRSGTWSTVRYARRIGRTVLMVWPDGSIDEEVRRGG